MTHTEKALVHGSTWAVAGSGFVYGWMRYFLSHDDPYTAINHPWQPAALAWHVVAAPILVFAVGLIAQEHILSRMKENARLPGRVSGLAAACVVVPMVLSGYALQVSVSPPVRRLALWVHLVTGALFFLTYLVHFAMSRRPVRPRAAQGEGDGIISPRARFKESRARLAEVQPSAGGAPMSRSAKEPRAMRPKTSTPIARVTLILLSVLAAAPFPATAADPTGRVQGTIVDRSGAGIEKAEIILTNKDIKTRVQKGKSKKDGKWVFPFVEQDPYIVSVNLPGYKIIKMTVESRGDGETEVTRKEHLLSPKDEVPPFDVPATGDQGFCKVDLIVVKEDEFVNAYRELRQPGEGGKKAEAGPAVAAPEAPPAGADPYDQGRQLAEAGKHAEATPLFQQALAQNPEDPNALYALGRSQLELGNSTEAEASLQKLVALNPMFTSAHYYLGKAQAAGYKNAAAISSFRKEIENSPDKKANLLLHIAGVQIEMAKTQPAALDQAQATLEEILAEDPNNTSALSQAADVYRQKGLKDKQEATYRRLVEADPANAHVTFFNLGAMAFNERRREEAEANFRKAVEINPKYAEAHLQLGYCLIGMNKIPEAVQHFEEYLSLEPAGARGAEVKKLIAQLKK